MAGAGSLKMIVVKTLKDAEKAVHYLRTNRIGRTSFVSLDKIRQYPEVNQPFKCP